jgi:hypothetical protein
VNGVAWDVRLRNASGEDASCGPFCRKPLIIAKAKGLYIYIHIHICIHICIFVCAFTKCKPFFCRKPLIIAKANGFAKLLNPCVKKTKKFTG